MGAVWDMDKPGDVRGAASAMLGKAKAMNGHAAAARKAHIAAVEDVYDGMVGGALSALASKLMKPYGFLLGFPKLVAKGTNLAVQAYEAGDGRFTAASVAAFRNGVIDFQTQVAAIPDPFAPPRAPNGKPIP